MVIRAGVVGHPIGHSLSPALHGRWLDRLGIDGTYEAVDPGADGFEACIARLRSEGWAGCNVTLPFKAAALAIADETDGMAKATGSANTLIFTEDVIVGSNTDALGFLTALRANSTHRVGGRAIESALVLGAGGTAPSVLAALKVEGVSELRLSNRTTKSAEALAQTFGATVVPWDERDGAADTDLLVNATALGLPGKPGLEIDLSALPQGAVVADCVYARGGTTPLVAAARARGLSAFDGLAMLVRQAVPGFAAWYGRSPKDEAEAEADLRALP